MLQVIFLHMSGYGGYCDSAVTFLDLAEFGQKHYMLQIYIWMLCRAPMIVWFMIYGYFCVDKNMVMRDGIKRAVHMRNPMLFYAVVLSILFVIPQQGIQMVEVLKALFPVSSNMWYFMTNYIILTLFVPFINKALESFEKRDYTILLANLLVICSVWRVLSTDIPGAKEVYDLKNVMLAGSKTLWYVMDSIRSGCYYGK